MQTPFQAQRQALMWLAAVNLHEILSRVSSMRSRRSEVRLINKMEGRRLDTLELEDDSSHAKQCH
jgi:hypothetical protein